MTRHISSEYKTSSVTDRIQIQYRLCLPPLMATQTASSKVIQKAPCLDFSREIDLDSMLAWTVYFIDKC